MSSLAHFLVADGAALPRQQRCKSNKCWDWIIDDETARVGVWRNFLPLTEANALLAHLEHSDAFQQLQFFIHGRLCTPRRTTCAFGDGKYRYSGQSVNADCGWGALAPLKAAAERACTFDARAIPFSYALVQRYPGADVTVQSGQSKRRPAAGIGEHADDERDLRPGAPIFSYTLMAPEPGFEHVVRKTRTFRLRRKSDRKVVNIELGHNDALIMLGNTQRFWTHLVPPTLRVKGTRYNATLRCMASSAASS